VLWPKQLIDEVLEAPAVFVSNRNTCLLAALMLVLILGSPLQSLRNINVAKEGFTPDVTTEHHSGGDAIDVIWISDYFVHSLCQTRDNALGTFTGILPIAEACVSFSPLIVSS